jgi:hypothetical protein
MAWPLDKSPVTVDAGGFFCWFFVARNQAHGE